MKMIRRLGDAQHELSTTRTKMKSFGYDDEGVLWTLVRDVVQDGAGHNVWRLLRR